MFSLKKKATLLILAGALAVPSFALAQEPQPTPAAAAVHAFSNVERRALTADIAEYSFKVRVGTGPYDEIGVHRHQRRCGPVSMCTKPEVG